MHRFYLPPGHCQGDSLMLTGREAHHGLHVVRIRRGETVLVLDGAGSKLECAAVELKRDAIRLEARRRELVPPPPCQITLVQAVPKGKLFDLIIQKATELGVSRIIPLLAERVVTQIDADQAGTKRDHWQAAAIEAIKQSGNPWLPRIEMPVTPATLLARKEEFDLPLIGSLEAGSRHPGHYFRDFAARHGSRPKSACVWVGPEGDFTSAELAAARSAGILPITLGRLVLRCDTAAVFCLSILNYELQAEPD